MKLLTDNLEIGQFIKETLDCIVPIFPIIAEKGCAYPFCVYRRTGFVAKNTKDVYDYESTISIELIIASQTYKESIRLAQQVKDKLEGYRGNWRTTTITGIYLDNCNEDFSDDAYIQRLYFTINVNDEAYHHRR